MKSATLGFLIPILPHRDPHLKSRSKISSPVASQDQWEQYDSRNDDNRARQREIARTSPARDRHHQVFLTNASKPTFNAASQRFMASIRDQYINRSESQITDKRLWIVEAIADDTFGTLRGPPDPPRVVVMESLDVSAKDEQDHNDTNELVSRWTAALNRAGKALSTIQSYHVDYAVWGGASSFGCFHQLQPGYLVACEILNADWTDASATENMRKTLLSNAQEAVENGKLLMYQVLQSVDEPTMFKTVEAYASMDDLREHMKSMDPEFAKLTMQFRAAVNRVRQLHRCMESLHGYRESR